MWVQDKYIKAWNFSSRVHNGQFLPGSNLPYINHIANVAMEAMAAIASEQTINKPDLLIQCALLHDVIEDTQTTYDELVSEFGLDVANGVLALSKNLNLPDKMTQMKDSLERIKQQPIEIWMVKLSDRITNLQPPPKHWNKEKIHAYGEEAKFILENLGSSSIFLASRLQAKIAAYEY
ncbi:MAG: HD domain-containing protein [gamma proteobacterium symbiont of Lucinoma myriamae]|nr:HD domain-containing protein [gamma proteobacterium symbiont of Lucinoma myriamae]MCU7819538.1 HD domain-containing protein [gamma proteobacterium symbiont of Lucinoma myriamae]MCU7833090.1 HD domain-containing protein [gamma proteobacterium symbiont of Lucinoma myriamae]